MINHGERNQLVRQLREQAEGWWHLGKDELWQQAAKAAHELEAGASSVQVKHVRFEVTDDGR